MKTNFTERAMIVRLSISQWTARKYDRKVSEKIEADYNAKNSGRWNKILIAEEAIKKITKISGEARNWHYENTLPWGDNGDRLLPVLNFENYKTKLESFRSTFTDIVSEFCIAYPSLIEEARNRLNGMFREEDYPPAYLISQKFSFSFSFYPVPSAEDFRVSVGQAEAETIRSAIQAETARLQEIADRNLWDRMREVTTHMVEKLTPQDAIFRDSLVQNVRDLCDTLRILNVHEDVDIEILRQEIEIKLAQKEPQVLRDSRRIRTEIAGEAAQILKKIDEGIGRKIKL